MRAVRAQKMLLGEEIRSAAFLHDQGKILAIIGAEEIPSGVPTLDAGELVVMPGLVDAHVHVNEPGRTEWEGFNSATQAAAAGGITTLVDMPLNCLPVTTSLAALETKIEALAGKLWVDVAFHGGVVPGNTSELAAMRARGVRSFKAFMIDSGIAEFAWSREADLRVAMTELKRLGGLLLAHAEVATDEPPPTLSRESYQAFLSSRPCRMENEAIALLVRLMRATACPVHIVHLSSAEALPLIAAAKAEGLALSAETCPHYLTLAAEHIPDGDGRFKCMPPIRSEANAEALWRGLQDGVIDFIASDHSPCTPALKRLESRDLAAAWGGISSLQFGLPLIWSELRRRGLGLPLIARWLAHAPAARMGLGGRKGQLAVGCDADFVLFDPEAAFTITKAAILHRHKETPYEGRPCYGVVHEAWLRGEQVYARGQFAAAPRGRTL